LNGTLKKKKSVVSVEEKKSPALRGRVEEEETIISIIEEAVELVLILSAIPPQ
jgi:hypothetical protein